MKLFVRIAAAGAFALATPALALPNAFWTFGWTTPGRQTPWTIGDARDAAPVSTASASPALGRPAPVEGEFSRIALASLAYEVGGL